MEIDERGMLHPLSEMQTAGVQESEGVEAIEPGRPHGKGGGSKGQQDMVSPDAERNL